MNSVGEHSTTTTDGHVTDHFVRCERCDKLLIRMATRPWEIFCRHCKVVNSRK